MNELKNNKNNKNSKWENKVLHNLSWYNKSSFTTILPNWDYNPFLERCAKQYGDRIKIIIKPNIEEVNEELKTFDRFVFYLIFCEEEMPCDHPLYSNFVHYSVDMCLEKTPFIRSKNDKALWVEELTEIVKKSVNQGKAIKDRLLFVTIQGLDDRIGGIWQKLYSRYDGFIETDRVYKQGSTVTSNSTVKLLIVNCPQVNWFRWESIYGRVQDRIVKTAVVFCEEELPNDHHAYNRFTRIRINYQGELEYL